MKRFLAALLVAAGASAGAAQVYAHHSFPGTYLDNQTVTIEGELIQILFRNPHSFVHVMVKEEDDSLVKYAVEWVAASELTGQGVTPTTLKHGDHVVISGTPGRNASDHRVRMISLHRPKDGFGWRMPAGRMTR